VSTAPDRNCASASSRWRYDFSVVQGSLQDQTVAGSLRRQRSITRSEPAETASSRRTRERRFRDHTRALSGNAELTTQSPGDALSERGPLRRPALVLRLACWRAHQRAPYARRRGGKPPCDGAYRASICSRSAASSLRSLRSWLDGHEGQHLAMARSAQPRRLAPSKSAAAPSQSGRRPSRAGGRHLLGGNRCRAPSANYQNERCRCGGPGDSRSTISSLRRIGGNGRERTSHRAIARHQGKALNREKMIHLYGLVG